MHIKKTITFESLKKIIQESADDWVYVDGVEIVEPGRFGMRKRWKQWFFNTPQEALAFCKDRLELNNGSSVETIRHASERFPIRIKDPEESWKAAIEIIHQFSPASTTKLNLGDFGVVEISTNIDINALKRKILDLIEKETSK